VPYNRRPASHLPATLSIGPPSHESQYRDDFDAHKLIIKRGFASYEQASAEFFGYFDGNHYSRTVIEGSDCVLSVRDHGALIAACATPAQLPANNESAICLTFSICPVVRPCLKPLRGHSKGRGWMEK